MDDQLKSLYEYTKWHNGIYLTLASGFGVVASTDSSHWPITFDAWWLGLSATLIAVAGMAGGVVATNTFESKKFDVFMERVIGPDILVGPARRLKAWAKSGSKWYRKCARFLLERCRPLLKGKRWTNYEHIAFWVGLACAAIALYRGRQPVWYTTRITVADVEVYLCIKDEQPHVAKYWDTNRGAETKGTLIWSQALTAGAPRSSSTSSGFGVTLEACEEACKQPLSSDKTRCAYAVPDASAPRVLANALAAALTKGPASNPTPNETSPNEPLTGSEETGSMGSSRVADTNEAYLFPEEYLKGQICGPGTPVATPPSCQVP